MRYYLYRINVKTKFHEVLENFMERKWGVNTPFEFSELKEAVSALDILGEGDPNMFICFSGWPCCYLQGKAWQDLSNRERDAVFAMKLCEFRPGIMGGVGDSWLKGGNGRHVFDWDSTWPVTEFNPTSNLEVALNIVDRMKCLGFSFGLFDYSIFSSVSPAPMAGFSRSIHPPKSDGSDSDAFYGHGHYPEAISEAAWQALGLEYRK